MNDIPSDVMPINCYGVGRCFVQPVDSPVELSEPPPDTRPRKNWNGEPGKPVFDQRTNTRYETMRDAVTATRCSHQSITLQCNRNDWVRPEHRRFRWATDADRTTAHADAAVDPDDDAREADERSDDEPAPEPAEPPPTPLRRAGRQYGPRQHANAMPIRNADDPEAPPYRNAVEAARAISNAIGRYVDAQAVRVCCNQRRRGTDARVAYRFAMEYVDPDGGQVSHGPKPRKVRMVGSADPPWANVHEAAAALSRLADQAISVNAVRCCCTARKNGRNVKVLGRFAVEWAEDDQPEKQVEGEGRAA